PVRLGNAPKAGCPSGGKNMTRSVTDRQITPTTPEPSRGRGDEGSPTRGTQGSSQSLTAPGGLRGRQRAPDIETGLPSEAVATGVQVGVRSQSLRRRRP